MLSQIEMERFVLQLRVRKVSLTDTVAGSQVITHGLNRFPERIVITMLDANVNVWYSDLTNQTVRVNYSGGANVSLEVS